MMVAKQTKHLSLILALMASLTLGACASTEQKPRDGWRVKYEEGKVTADAAFDQGNYAEAMETYLIHASMGSKFSQYRIAYMNEHGLGVSANLIDAYAWALLASEEGTQSLVEYRKQLAARLSPQERIQAETRALALFDRHSTYAIMEKTYRDSRATLNSCTGSRVGNSCDQLTVIPPGDIHGYLPLVLTEEGTYKTTAQESAGIPGYVFFRPYKQDLAVSREYILHYGEASLGELRIIEDGYDGHTDGQATDQESQEPPTPYRYL